jgi:two-component system, OmpR family, response regulator
MGVLSRNSERQPRFSRAAREQSTRLRVAIIDDHPPMRTLIRVVLKASGTATLVAEADGTRRMVRSACRQQPQVVLLNQRLGGRPGGIDLIGDILRSGPCAMIATFAGLDSDIEEAPALHAGAFAFYDKRVVTTALPTLLAQDYALFRRALAGEDVCAPTATDRRRVCTEASQPVQHRTPASGFGTQARRVGFASPSRY